MGKKSELYDFLQNFAFNNEVDFSPERNVSAKLQSIWNLQYFPNTEEMVCCSGFRESIFCQQLGNS